MPRKPFERSDPSAAREEDTRAPAVHAVMHGGSGGGRRHTTKMVYIPLPFGHSRRVGVGWVILVGLGLGAGLRIARGKSEEQ